LGIAALCGADVVPVNDFSLYDHVLDTAWLSGAMPQRYTIVAGVSEIHLGPSNACRSTPASDAACMEMTRRTALRN